MLLAFDDFVLDPERRELRQRDEPLKVDALVIDLLVYLASRPEELITHEALIEHVWGGRAVADNVVSVCMAKLRKALGHRRGEHEVVVNVYGRGYRFVRPVRRLARGSQPPQLPGADSPSPTRPFVGRAPTMARLEALLGEAIGGRGRLCALLGEPGIGKTRLAETLEAHGLARGVQVAWGRSRDLSGSPPLWPWVQVVREVLSVVSVEDARARLHESFSELTRLLPELGGAPDATLDAGATRHRTHDAVCRLLALATERAPWLVVLDDLHRADSATLGLLAYLVDELARLRVLVVCTVRSTEPELPAEPQQLLDYTLGHRNAERFELSRLSAAEVADYTAAVLGRTEPELSAQVFTQSEGNPFFMTELLREANAGSRDVRLARLSGVALELPRQRVRSLGPDSLAVLTRAAVIGRSFDIALLAAVTGLPAPQVLEQLEEALAIDVVVAAPGELGRFAFDHDLLREVLLDALSSTERAELHVRVADALAAQRDSGRTVSDAELAHHRLRALPLGDPGRAARAATRAAEQALQAAAYPDAAALLHSALDALSLAPDAAPAQRARLHYLLGLSLRAFDASGSIAQLREAVRIARAHGLYDTLASCGLLMVGAPGVVMIADGRGVLEDALAGLPEDAQALRALSLCHLAWCAPICFDRDQATALVEQGTQAATRSGNAHARFVALRARIHLSAGPRQRFVETEALVAQANAVVRELGPASDGLWRMQRRTLLAVLAAQRGDTAAVHATLAELTDGERARYPELGWHLDRIAVIDRFNRGELAGMPEKLTALRERAQRLRLFAYEAVCGYDLLLWLGATRPAWSGASAALPQLQPVPEDPPGVLAIKLRSALLLGQTSTMRAIVGEFVARGLDKLPCDRDYLSVLGYLSLATAALDAAEPAAQLVELLAPYAEYAATDMSMHTAGSVSHLLGLLCRLRGRPDAALAHFERAVAHNEALELRAHAIDSRIELAVELGRSVDSPATRTRALELATRARDAARELGHAGHEARAEAVLAASR